MVYPALQVSISSEPAVFSVEKPIQLMLPSELTIALWLRPTGFVPLPPGLPIPCAQRGQSADGIVEWQLLTVNYLLKSSTEPMLPDQTSLTSPTMPWKYALLEPP